MDIYRKSVDMNIDMDAIYIISPAGLFESDVFVCVA